MQQRQKVLTSGESVEARTYAQVMHRASRRGKIPDLLDRPSFDLVYYVSCTKPSRVVGVCTGFGRTPEMAAN